jgi:hypothetical protein
MNNFNNMTELRQEARDWVRERFSTEEFDARFIGQLAKCIEA